MKFWTDDKALVLDRHHAQFFQAACRAFNPLLNEAEREEAVAYAEQAFKTMEFVDSQGEWVYVKRESTQ